MIFQPRVVVSVALVCGSAVRAQSPATLIGIVLRDSAGSARVGGAEVRLSGVQQPVTTNYLGEFRITGLQRGRYEVTIRRLGFLPYRDTVEIPPSGRLEREFVLAEQPVTLDSVRVATTERKYISPGLNAFEERRKAGFGHFITDSVLRRNDERPLAGVIVSYVPGVRLARGTGTYISSMRKCGDGPAFLTCRGPAVQCPPAMYVDGVLVYNPAVQTDPRLRPDLSLMLVREYAGVEFYNGGATIPAQYNQTGNGCGVLLLWTRER
jgi:hypothetical protein